MATAYQGYMPQMQAQQQQQQMPPYQQMQQQQQPPPQQQMMMQQQQQQQAPPAAAPAPPQPSPSSSTSFETGHLDAVHDAQLDYYGRRLATCSSDRTVKVWDVSAGGEQRQLLADLHGHEGPVWQVAWAHPRFGSLLASASFDHRVVVWREGADGAWTQAYSAPVASGSVNAVAWAPHELGLALAAASSDGSVTVVEHRAHEGAWAATKIERAHAPGATAVSWAPAAPAGALVGGPAAPSAPAAAPARRLVSAGCDNAARVWRQDPATGAWEQEAALLGHSDWCRDAAWAPGIGMPRSQVATCGQDGKVLVWTVAAGGGGGGGGQWRKAVVHDFGPSTPVWRVSWSLAGGLLAASDGANRVTLWKESADGLWQQVEA
jgi:protein transport protein SEC13